MNTQDRKEAALKLVEKAKECFHKGDVKNAAKAWCKIYDLYENSHSMEDVSELHSVMARFTDNEVFGITDYLKEEYYKKNDIVTA